MYQKILLAFLVLNALFWGLASHSRHCKVASMISSGSCPPHWVHLTMGLIFYMLAVYVQQKKYIHTLI